MLIINVDKFLQRGGILVSDKQFFRKLDGQHNIGQPWCRSPQSELGYIVPDSLFCFLATAHAGHGTGGLRIEKICIFAGDY